MFFFNFDMTNFENWDKEFRAQNLFAFNNNDNGLLYLKVRAVCRGKQKVNDYLDSFSNQSLKKIDFTFNKKSYESLADIIFVVKE